MNKEELIKTCRYYNGEKECPYSGGEIAWFWDMERIYVEKGGIFEGEVETYTALHGRIYKEIPFNLLMIMFTSWGKSGYIDKLDGFYELLESYLRRD